MSWKTGDQGETEVLFGFVVEASQEPLVGCDLLLVETSWLGPELLTRFSASGALIFVAFAVAWCSVRHPLSGCSGALAASL